MKLFGRHFILYTWIMGTGALFALERVMTRLLYGKPCGLFLTLLKHESGPKSCKAGGSQVSANITGTTASSKDLGAGVRLLLCVTQRMLKSCYSTILIRQFPATLNID